MKGLIDLLDPESVREALRVRARETPRHGVAAANGKSSVREERTPRTGVSRHYVAIERAMLYRVPKKRHG